MLTAAPCAAAAGRQALKLHGVAENGALAKQLISTGEVKVNGDVETTLLENAARDELG